MTKLIDIKDVPAGDWGDVRFDTAWKGVRRVSCKGVRHAVRDGVWGDVWGAMRSVVCNAAWDVMWDDMWDVMMGPRSHIKDDIRELS